MKAIPVCIAACLWSSALAIAGGPPPGSEIPGPGLRNTDHGRDVPVTFMRDGGFGGVVPNARIRVNGRDVATLGAGDKITIYVAPGRVVFGVGAWSTERRFAETIVAGAPQRFRITQTPDNRFLLTRASDTAR